MRLLNVDVVVCDRCTRRVELTTEQKETGYGTLVLRAMRGEPVDRGNLSPSEEKILDLVAKGLSNKHIAREFNIAEATVKVHVKGILRKTRSRNRTQAAMLRRQNVPHGPERVATAVEMTADLCEDCIEGLRGFMRNGAGELRP